MLLFYSKKLECIIYIKKRDVKCYLYIQSRNASLRSTSMLPFGIFQFRTQQTEEMKNRMYLFFHR